MKIVSLFSGGIDSTTLLYYLVDRGFESYPLVIDYGQRHRKEIDYALQITKLLKLPAKIIDISNLGVFGGSALTDNIAVPKGEYTNETLAITVVPNRNMVFLSLASAYAMSIGAEEVAYAAHAGDHPLYPDCRAEFIRAMRKAIYLATGVELVAPFVNKSKSDIVVLGSKLSVPFHLTWSCYEGEEVQCGECSTCRERKQAFMSARVIDSTIYKR